MFIKFTVGEGSIFARLITFPDKGNLIPPFFNSVPDAEWWLFHHREMIAVGIIVSSVLIFWFTQVFSLPMEPLVMIGGGASSFSVCFLGRVGHDFLSFFAMQFFSILLFHSIGRKRESVALPLISHVIGVVAYAVVSYVM